jgi:hypothetical protein
MDRRVGGTQGLSGLGSEKSLSPGTEQTVATFVSTSERSSNITWIYSQGLIISMVNNT